MNSELEQLKKRMVKRARLQAVVYSILMLVTLITLVYTFFEQSTADREIKRLQTELVKSRAEAAKNAELAKKETERANMISEAATQALKECLSKSYRRR